MSRTALTDGSTFTTDAVMGESVAPRLKPMLAKDADLGKLGWPQIGQPKLDGIRALVVNGVVLSRTLKPIPNQSIQDALGRDEFEGFDGELIVGLDTAEDCYRKTSSFVMAPNKTGEPWSFMVFDLWNDTAPYALRASRLEMILDRFVHTDAPVHAVPSRPLHSRDELDQYEADLLAVGHEGVILRDPAGLYKFGRSGKTGPLLKVKQFIDFEAEVVGYYEQMHNANEATTNALGRTERSTKKAGLVPTGMLGGLVVKAINGPAEGVTFEVGTGFKRDERIALWTDLDALGGRVVKVKSFPIGVKDKPRHPVFLGWRDLKIDG